MDSFSWSDAMRACMPCFKPSRSGSSDEDQQQQNSRATSLSARAELERLLEADDEAETLSLHSNIGVRDRTRTKPRTRRNITLFGFNLFGKPQAIALPDSDDESAEPQRGRRGRRQRTASTQSVDSDAAPVQDSTIDNLSRAQALWEPTVTEDDLLREEHAQRDREERRAARKMRKEMKRAAAALAAGEDGGFEGFPGSGNYAPNAMPHLNSGADDFGDFVRADSASYTDSVQSQQPLPKDTTAAAAEAADVAEADFEGATYARRGPGSQRSNGGSDTRSTSSGGKRGRGPQTVTTASSAAAPHTPPAHSPVQLAHPQEALPSPVPITEQVPEFPAARFPSTGFSISISGRGDGFVSTGFARPKNSPGTFSAASFRDALSG